MKEEIFAFEEMARANGIVDTDQRNYAFYDFESSEYYIVRNEAGRQSGIEFIPLILDITEVTISRRDERHNDFFKVP